MNPSFLPTTGPSAVCPERMEKGPTTPRPRAVAYRRAGTSEFYRIVGSGKPQAAEMVHFSAIFTPVACSHCRALPPILNSGTSMGNELEYRIHTNSYFRL